MEWNGKSCLLSREEALRRTSRGRSGDDGGQEGWWEGDDLVMMMSQVQSVS